MQDREPSTFEIWSGNVVGGQRPQPPASLLEFPEGPIATTYWWCGSHLAIGHAPLCWSLQRWWQALDWDGPAA